MAWRLARGLTWVLMRSSLLLGDEGKNLHLPTAVRTGQRVHVVDPVNELGPSFAQSAAGREALGRLRRRLAVPEGGAHAFGVGAVEMDEVLVRLGNVDEG